MAAELTRLVGLDWKVRDRHWRESLRRASRVARLCQFGVTAATDEVDAVGSSFVQLNLKLQRSSDRRGTLPRTPRSLA